MISLYLNQNSWLHSLPTGSKLLALAGCSIALLNVEHIELMALAIIVSVLLYISLGQGGWRHLEMAKPLIPFLAFILLIHAFADTLQEGMISTSRLLVMFLIANLVTLTTRMSDMMNTLQPFFKPLQWVGLHPRSLALAVALMIRFAPVLVNVLNNLDEAWRSRGGGKQKWKLLIPLIVQGITLSDHVAEALTARGGSSGVKAKPIFKE